MKTGLSPQRQLKVFRKVSKFLHKLSKDPDELKYARECVVRHVEAVLFAVSPQADREDADPDEGVRANPRRFNVVSVNPLGTPQ